MAGAYLSADGSTHVDDELAFGLLTQATRWYAVPRVHRLTGAHGRGRRHEREPGDAERRDEIRAQLGEFTLPPETILIRRMHAIVAAVLGQLRADANWGAIAAEYLYGEPAATPLGQAEAEYFRRSGPACGERRRPRGQLAVAESRQRERSIRVWIA
jgi:hypothetical protein